MEISIFIPCFIDQVNPEIGFKMIYILEKLGCKVHYNTNQTCCGQPAYNSGFQEEACQIANKFVNDFSEPRPIVSPSGSCTGYVSNYFPKMTQHQALDATKCYTTISNIWEFTNFIVSHFDLSQLNMHLDAIVTYHDGCGSLRECKIKKEPRVILDAIKGLKVVEMKEAETCCGFGGTFAVKFEPISTGMAYTKAHSAVDTGAKYMISGDYSCLMHINSYIEKSKLPIQGLHIIELMYMSMH